MGKKYVKVKISGKQFKILPQDIKKIYRTNKTSLPPVPSYNKRIAKKLSLDTDIDAFSEKFDFTT